MTKLLFIILILSNAAWAEIPGEYNHYPFKFGFKQSSNTDELSDSPFEQKIYGEAKGSYYYLNEYEGPSANYQVRLYNEFKENDRFRADIRDLTLEYKSDFYTLSAGRQVLTWSETFGLNIMDIVNPRDYSYGVLDDYEWSKTPVLLGTAKFFGESWFVELLVNPYGENNKLAKEGTEYDPYKALSFEREERDDHKIEYGARGNYLFESGLDLSLIYYHHMNRNPFYYLDSDFKLKTSSDMVDSFGTTFSYSFNDWVVRGDLLYNDDNPAQFGTLGLKKKNWYQSIIGADWSGVEQLVLGAQLITDSLNAEEWIGVQVKKDYLNFEFLVMGIAGLDNSDLWLRPEVQWKGFDNFTMKLRADLLHGKSDSGIIGKFKDNDRLEIELSYLY